MPDSSTPRAPRSSVKLPVRVWVLPSDRESRAEALNVSVSGVLLGIEPPPPVGSDLQIAFPGVPDLFVPAEVVRVASELPVPGVGAAFGEMPVEIAEFIAEIVKAEFAIEHYQLDDLLAVGGMAEVYQATARAGIFVGQTVAIKRLRAEYFADAERVALLRTETRIAAMLDHPAIVRQFEANLDCATPYIAMEFIDGCSGETLIERCTRERIALPVPLAVYIAHEIAGALEYLHALRDPVTGQPMGLVHRDVTPGNILIARDGTVKLADFGVVHVGTDDAITEAGENFGKVGYAAPEQYRHSRATPATDVFGLGATLFHLLTCADAFAGQHTGQILARVRAGKSRRASTLRGTIPVALDDLLVDAMIARRGAMDDPWLLRPLRKIFRVPARIANMRAFADRLAPLLTTADIPDFRAALADWLADHGMFGDG